MVGVELIRSPWQDYFLNMVRQTDQLTVVAPYIKAATVNAVLLANPEIKVDVLTSFNLMNFYRKASDLEALKMLLARKGNVISLSALHAKVYLFDDRQAIVTSANFTVGGMVRNLEYGVSISDRGLLKQIRQDIKDLSRQADACSVKEKSIQEAEEILARMPQELKLSFENVHLLEVEAEPFVGGKGAIFPSLKGWKLDVFRCVDLLDSEEFSLADLKGFEIELKQLHPHNYHISDKVRQQLQQLRNIGLIQFLGNGRYRRLWV